MRLDEETSKLANRIYFNLREQTGMPQYQSLREKEAMWEKAVQEAKYNKSKYSN